MSVISLNQCLNLVNHSKVKPSVIKLTHLFPSFRIAALRVSFRLSSILALCWKRTLRSLRQSGSVSTSLLTSIATMSRCCYSSTQGLYASSEILYIHVLKCLESAVSWAPPWNLKKMTSYAAVLQNTLRGSH